jgi:hypothetical protein
MQLILWAAATRTRLGVRHALRSEEPDSHAPGWPARAHGPSSLSPPRTPERTTTAPARFASACGWIFDEGG